MKIVAIFLSLFFALTCAKSFAQTQKTLGLCSHNFKKIRGNISVTCITGDKRIRIAKFTEFLDKKGGQNFSEFLYANFGKIVRVDTATDGTHGLYEDAEVLGKDNVYQGHLKVPESENCEGGWDCGGLIVYFNKLDAESTAYWEHSFWKFTGYYFIGCGGGGQGWIEYCLTPIKDEEIAMSSKYED